MSLSRASRLKMDMRRSKRKKMESRKRLLSEFLTPEDAITRYKRVLEAVNKGNNKTAAYRAVGVDRKTIADTAGIAELHAVNPGIFQDIRGTLKKGETLLRFSEMCKSAIKDQHLEGKVQDLKTNGGLLSINPKGK
ncbi:coiled-coil domain-containing protein 106-like [Trematomus bernacchii]|uniref:coiled-coil domain-containing protein 106-like n=1 Tax=Trematomus bernacchii TaxID=40690 RepID=UPI00146D8DBF|nr:coiled-coil domain-containing protein 106-like [Trematomus bernacchii]